ncbi:hypothetical protein QWY86_03590 [Pedobacter aquatilis]|uniref:hypothetical protein n=1 Tax=Pedobacter aquatilis TaxID=351343 RepID=UPI0025B5DC61|nr:hypothetical protein [Pedobacter aquatilis]MDN3585734.1 hypothetical protein [Pedobacter aquatilis]
MKPFFIIISCLVLAKFCLAQSLTKSIDYQYFRDDKTYYAYSISRNITPSDKLLFIDFCINKPFKKIEKICLIEGGKEYKLKITTNNKTASSDNPEIRFYSLIINSVDLIKEHIKCESIIAFKLDDATVVSLPFNKCLIIESLNKG